MVLQKDMCSLPSVPGTELLKPWDFPSGKGDRGICCSVRAHLPGPSQQQYRAGCHKDQARIRSLELSAPSPSIGEGEELELRFNHQWSTAYSGLHDENPTESPEQQGAEGLG